MVHSTGWLLTTLGPPISPTPFFRPQVRKHKWDNYISGEELFGLPVTPYPELEQTEKEIAALDRLYSLYVNVIGTIKGYGDYLWCEVVERINEMGDQVRQRMRGEGWGRSRSIRSHKPSTG